LINFGVGIKNSKGGDCPQNKIIIVKSPVVLQVQKIFAGQKNAIKLHRFETPFIPPGRFNSSIECDI
jgi:hypothetical protein